MKFKTVGLFVIIAVCMVLTFATAPHSAHAATLDSFTVTNIIIGSQCSDYSMTFDYTFTAQVAEYSGTDLVGYTVVDGNGVAVAASWQGFYPGGSYTDTRSFGPGDIINNFTARPLIFTFYDITTNPPAGQNNQAIFDAIVNQNAPVLATFTHDPAVASSYCASLPFIQPASSTSLATDGRINPDAGAPFVAYVVNNGLHVYYPQGNLRLVVSAEEIAAVGCPTSGAALIAQGNGVSVYRLADCSFQMQSASLNGEKIYILQFASLTDRTYRSVEVKP
ncbi:MAG: hypothetical protein CUN55_02570 [Phototrophicales bacterium]|nr:MAG: hypothetical protein CUN55_02570 [Phototrophicales bacterium]